MENNGESNCNYYFLFQLFMLNFSMVDQSIRGSKLYTVFMKNFRKEHPICADPFSIHNKIIVPSQHIHHIIPFEQAPDKCFDKENLIALCPFCHLCIHRSRKDIKKLLEMKSLKEIKETYGYVLQLKANK